MGPLSYMKHTLVTIEWRDIQANHHWVSEDEALRWAKKQYNCAYYTTGYLLHEDKELVVVAASWTEDEEGVAYNDVSMIMRSVITNIKKI